MMKTWEGRLQYRTPKGPCCVAVVAAGEKYISNPVHEVYKKV